MNQKPGISSAVRVSGTRLVLAACIAVAAGAAVLTPLSAAQAGVFSERPDVLVCSVDDPINVQRWDRLVFYVSAQLEDGGILYKSLTSNPILITITADGLVDAKNLVDCDGRRVADLRAEGRAFDF